MQPSPITLATFTHSIISGGQQQHKSSASARQHTSLLSPDTKPYTPGPRDPRTQSLAQRPRPHLPPYPTLNPRPQDPENPGRPQRPRPQRPRPHLPAYPRYESIRPPAPDLTSLLALSGRLSTPNSVPLKMAGSAGCGSPRILQPQQNLESQRASFRDLS